MKQARLEPEDGQIRVVGSLGSANALKKTDLSQAMECCDVVEIRLDLTTEPGRTADPSAWSHLKNLPLLFTARRKDEGGAQALTVQERMDLLEIALDDAALVDVEIASTGEMRPLLEKLHARGIPWIASFHDFSKTPEATVLEAKLTLAKQAGASVFKVAATLHDTADLARLAEFQLADHGIAVSTMGMGPLAPVSRLLCAQYGSVLNYGYLGETPTAPGQWGAEMLKSGISRLAPIRR